jgi:hypothetical protein
VVARTGSSADVERRNHSFMGGQGSVLGRRGGEEATHDTGGGGGGTDRVASSWMGCTKRSAPASPSPASASALSCPSSAQGAVLRSQPHGPLLSSQQRLGVNDVLHDGLTLLQDGVVEYLVYPKPSTRAMLRHIASLLGV